MSMLLVYTHKITPRVKYVFKHICTRILGVPVDFTDNVQEFIAHDSLKMSYTTQPLGNEFYVKSHAILFEQGLTDQEFTINKWEETKGFYSCGEKSSLPFDIFASSFYLLSRYEEYLPHLKDEYGRFTVRESLAYKHHFLHQPIVDIWAFKFKEKLRAKLPNFEFKQRQYNVNPIIDVPMAFYYKQKGLMRTIGGAINELFHLEFLRFYRRFLVLFGFRKDPYDTFDWIIEQQKKVKRKFNVFFLIGDYSTYDKNISINKKVFVSLIKSVSDYCNVGLKASYFALTDSITLKREKRRMENTVNTTLEMSRNSFSKINLPHNYRHLIDNEINADFTMGYVNYNGFRAGTCTPFLFYDLDYEIQTPLMIHPFHVMDYALLKHNSLLDKQQELQRYIQEIKKVDGTFAPVFHNYSFSDDEPRWTGFKDLFLQVLNSVDEL